MLALLFLARIAVNGVRPGYPPGVFKIMDPDQKGYSEESELKVYAALADWYQKKISFAEQCVKMFSVKSRKKGAESHKKSKKRGDTWGKYHTNNTRIIIWATYDY